jgi:ABC-type phosphate/phosphonate transport system permease subunit
LFFEFLCLFVALILCFFVATVTMGHTWIRKS